MGNFALFGEKLSHSYSPLLHYMIYKDLGIDSTYSLLEFEKDSLKEYIKKIKEGIINGANVTIPYKVEVMQYVDIIDSNAEKIGAVNTVCLKRNTVFATNTDYYGIEKTLEDTRKDGVYLILGYGGAAKTVLTYLLNNGAKKVYIATRNKYKYISKDNICKFVGYDEISTIKGDVIINTTPVGMSPHCNDNPISHSFDVYNNFKVAFDLIYNPTETEFLKEARKHGLDVRNGLKMLVYQGIKSCEFFLEEKFCVDDMFDKIYPKILDIINGSKKNISLVGMPGCGKSTIGKIVAQRLGFEYVDLDEYIENLEGMCISDIFSTHGETYFREVEERCLKEVLKRDFVVISTGGGSVLRESNRDFLMKHSLVIYLDRSVEDILGDVDVNSRPLLQGNKNRLRELYNQRYRLYEVVSDIRIKNNSSIDKVVNVLLDILKIYKIA